jgi:hypothetical protein
MRAALASALRYGRSGRLLCTPTMDTVTCHDRLTVKQATPGMPDRGDRSFALQGMPDNGRSWAPRATGLLSNNAVRSSPRVLTLPALEGREGDSSRQR